MTDQLETYLRERMTADAELAPLPAHDLAATVRAQVRGQRQRNAAVAGSALAALLLVLVLVLAGFGSGGRSSAPPAEHTPDIGTGILRLNGVEVSVPRKWVTGPCAADAPRDTAYVVDGTGKVYSCPLVPNDQHPERRSRVLLEPWQLSPPEGYPTDVGEQTLSDGRTGIVRRPAPDMRLTVISPNRDLALAIADSATTALPDRPFLAAADLVTVARHYRPFTDTGRAPNTDAPVCQVRPAGWGADELRATSFVQEGTTAGVNEFVLRYATAEQARGAFAAARSYFATCPTTGPDFDVTVRDWQPAPVLDEAQRMSRFTVPSTASETEYNEVAVARRANIVVVLDWGSIDGPSVDVNWVWTADILSAALQAAAE